MKKEPLKLVEPPKKGLYPHGKPKPAPSDLKPAGKELWLTVNEQFVVDDAGSIALLVECCRACDRIAEFGKLINRDGPLLVNARGEAKEHPLLKHELLARNFLAQSLVRLGIVDAPRRPQGRPSGMGNLGIIDRFAAMNTNGDSR